MKQPIPPFSYGPIRLRLLQKDDLPATLEWRNRDGVRQQFFSGELISWDHHAAWFTRYAGKNDDFVFIAEELASGQRIGQVSLYDINLAHADAEVGRFIVAPEFAGRGLMRAAIEALSLLAATSFGLHRLRLEVKASNSRAYRLYESLRFEVTGRGDSVIHMERKLVDGP